MDSKKTINIPTHIIEKAKTASLEPWGCVEWRTMYCNYDFDFNDWHVSPLYCGPDDDENMRSFAKVERGNVIFIR